MKFASVISSYLVFVCLAPFIAATAGLCVDSLGCLVLPETPNQTFAALSPNVHALISFAFLLQPIYVCWLSGLDKRSEFPPMSASDYAS